jgi:hypothetical protein
MNAGIVSPRLVAATIGKGSTRLTDAFQQRSKIMRFRSLHSMNYNFGRIHKTLRVTPAIAAGVMDQLWGIGV